MCDICSAVRPYQDDCFLSEFNPENNPGYGETWAEWFEAPDFAHSSIDAGFMTVNSTFDGGIGYFGDSDWLRVEFTEGSTYTIQMYSFSMETHLALADNNGNVLTSDSYELVTYAGTTYAVSEFTVTASRTGTYYVIAEESGHNGTGAYTVGIVELSTGTGELEAWSLDDIAHRLTDTGWSFFNGTRRAWDQDVVTYDISGLSSSVRPMVEHAFDAWAKVTGLTFAEVTGGADITFDDSDAGKAYANSQISGGVMQSANINIAQDFADQGTTLDSYVFQTFMHEIGHAIGLAHAGDYNAGQGGPTTFPDSVLFLNDSWNTTIMSYINQDVNTEDGADYALVMTPMIADIIAVQDLYGVPIEAYHGDTRYGVNSNTGDYMDIVFGSLTEGDTSSSLINGDQPLSFTLWDTGGEDVIDFSTDTQKQNVDLREEALSKIYGVKGAMVIGRDTEIEDYYAGSAKDKVIGNDANNMIDGGDGSDELKGRDGKDKLIGGKGKDTLDGGKGKDTLKGEKGDDSLGGGDNSDTLKGGDGQDTLTGGNGGDELLGGKHEDVVKGGAGKDRINGQKGNDTLTGGDGADVFVYEKDGDKDKIRDFEDNSDSIELSSDLWTGTKSAQDVIDDFGSMKNGDAILKFGNGDQIKVVDTTLTQLSDDLIIV